ncbi:glycerate kinase [Shewanella sp. WXL01]|uniref:glycerate kinase n=1 Tax=Shewanella sp. WXL01 TaxID=2709721 RepID=UPI00143831D7|nr:glycerate kinase [Shewanella sp. WXL01]NKF51819.1 glycerate kinase [Shewanella sp. WXL01]
MKIVIAPDSFKESLTALEVAEAIEQGFKQELPDAQYIKVPMADGGEGTVQAMVDATQGSIIKVNVSGPLGDNVEAFYGLICDEAGVNDEKTAVIEMAAASGLHHVQPELRNPLVTTSFGTGELIKHALDNGVTKIILGLGGSATNDAGVGMLQALGAKFFDANDQVVAQGGLVLRNISSIDTSNLHPGIDNCQFLVACDVDNPLCGERGASAVFGPQKGATELMVEQLDAALANFARVTAAHLNQQQDVASLAGSGAAGGMGYGVMSYLNGTLSPGVKIVTQTVNLASYCKGADLVITGEGRLDGQTVYGKTPMGVLEVANQLNVPTIAIAGCLGDNAEAIKSQGAKAIFAVVNQLAPLETVLAQAKHNLVTTSANIAATLKLNV